MNFKLLVGVCGLFLIGCKSSKNISSQPLVTNIGEVSKLPDTVQVKDLNCELLVGKYEDKSFKKSQVSTVKVDSKIFVNVGGQSYNLSLNFRILRGNKIWVNANYAGITVAKMLVEPNRIQYYNKIDHTFFDGTFALLHQMLGTAIDYQSLESLLVGDLVFDVKKWQHLTGTGISENVIYDPFSEGYHKEVDIYKDIYKIKYQKIEEKFGASLLAVNYKSYEPINNILYPKEIQINGKNKGKESLFAIQNEKIEFNSELTFPFKIPEECNKPIVLNAKTSNEK